MRNQAPIKTKMLTKTNVKDMVWTLIRDRIEEDAKKIQKRKISYIESNQVPGSGE
jgi:hypothetical protein